MSLQTLKLGVFITLKRKIIIRYIYFRFQYAECVYDQFPAFYNKRTVVQITHKSFSFEILFSSFLTA